MGSKARPAPAQRLSASISPEVAAEILTARVSESPTPSHRQLADRFGVSKSAVQRLLKKSESAVSRLDRAGVKAELVVDALPGAIAEVKALTRDLPITSLCKVMQEAEKQYNKHKDLDPQLAGGYLDQMRKCAVEMAKWLGIDKGLGLQDNSVKFEVVWRDGR